MSMKFGEIFRHRYLPTLSIWDEDFEVIVSPRRSSSVAGGILKMFFLKEQSSGEKQIFLLLWPNSTFFLLRTGRFLFHISYSNFIILSLISFYLEEYSRPESPGCLDPFLILFKKLLSLRWKSTCVLLKVVIRLSRIPTCQ